MVVLTAKSAQTFTGTTNFLPHYSQNDLSEEFFISSAVKTFEESDHSFSSTGRDMNIDQSHTPYKYLESSFAIDDGDYDDRDYIEDTAVESFAKTTINIKVKVKKIEKMRITL